nr:MAG TPA: hypothetical protein [Caudoviricetes sp.]
MIIIGSLRHREAGVFLYALPDGVKRRDRTIMRELPRKKRKRKDG